MPLGRSRITRWFRSFHKTSGPTVYVYVCPYSRLIFGYKCLCYTGRRSFSCFFGLILEVEAYDLQVPILFFLYFSDYWKL